MAFTVFDEGHSKIHKSSTPNQQRDAARLKMENSKLKKLFVNVDDDVLKFLRKNNGKRWYNRGPNELEKIIKNAIKTIEKIRKEQSDAAWKKVEKLRITMRGGRRMISGKRIRSGRRMRSGRRSRRSRRR